MGQYPGGLGGLQENQGPTDAQIRAAGYTPFKDTVSVRPPFETAEQRNLYKLACVGSLVVGIAEEALNLASGLVQDEIGLVDKGVAAQRLRELRKKLDEACDFGS